MKKLIVCMFFALMASSAFALTPFKLQWMNHEVPGTYYDSNDHPAGIFVLEFYASFCGDCNANAPNVDEIAAAYANEPRVQVLDVGIDRSDSQYQQWIQRHHPNHPVIADRQRILFNPLGTGVIPTMVILDCNGRELFRHIDIWDDATKQKIKEVVDGQLAQECGVEQ